ncbi:hypothetical protein TNCV_633551 [Trichonephila clavipes]|nr:hypothetical protein TNCV_633551 [Trichonephila clavipes]
MNGFQSKIRFENEEFIQNNRLLLGSNSCHAGHECITLSTRLLRPRNRCVRKKCNVSYEDLLTINGIKYSVFQESARATSLSKSEDCINKVLDDAVSVMYLKAEKRQEN